MCHYYMDILCQQSNIDIIEEKKMVNRYRCFGKIAHTALLQVCLAKNMRGTCLALYIIIDIR